MRVFWAISYSDNSLVDLQFIKIEPYISTPNKFLAASISSLGTLPKRLGKPKIVSLDDEIYNKLKIYLTWIVQIRGL